MRMFDLCMIHLLPASDHSQQGADAIPSPQVLVKPFKDRHEDIWLKQRDRCA